jgi:hypothetical protein
MSTQKIREIISNTRKTKGIKEKGYLNNKAIISVDKKYFRPTEVDSLLGNSSKARKEADLYKFEFHKLKQEYNKTNSLLEHYKGQVSRRDSVYYNLRTGSGTIQDSNESTSAAIVFDQESLTV